MEETGQATNSEHVVIPEVNEVELNNAVKELINSDSTSVPPAPGRKKKKKRGAKPGTVPWNKGLKKNTTNSNSTNNTPNNPGSSEPLNDYQIAKKKYMEGLDKDSTEDKGPDQVVKTDKVENFNQTLTNTAKPKGKSLIVMAKLVLPPLIALAVRIATNGKKKPGSKAMRFDQYELDSLKDLADDAAEEIIGSMSPALGFALVMAGLAVGKGLDYADDPLTGGDNPDLVPVSELQKLRDEFEAYKKEMQPV